MTSLDVLHYSLALFLLVMMGTTVFIAILIARLLENIKTITKAAKDSALSVKLLEGGLKLGVLKFVQILITNFTKGGVINGRNKG